jgi:hypothetical protein
MKIEINILQYKEYSSELSIMSGTVHETPLSSSSSSSAPGGGMTIDIRPMIEDVSQVMTKHITNILTGVIGEYTIYKETHDTIMGLPCVRKLQDRIMELEQMGGGGGGVGVRGDTATSSMSTNSREDEIAQLQSAIVDLNRYIHALESKVDMKSMASTGAGQSDANRPEEESVKLEVHEHEQQQEEDDEQKEDEDVCVVSSTTHKNVIVTADAVDEEANAEEEEESEEEAEEEEVVESDEEEAADQEEEEAPAEEEEEAADDDDAAQEENADQEEGEEGEEGEEEEDDEETNEKAEEADDAEEVEVVEEDETEVVEEEEAEVAAEEEETEEVEEVKIKGKTYFTTDPQNGIIYACIDDDVGDEVGVFKNGVAIFNKGKK